MTLYLANKINGHWRQEWKKGQLTLSFFFFLSVPWSLWDFSLLTRDRRKWKWKHLSFLTPNHQGSPCPFPFNWIIIDRHNIRLVSGVYHNAFISSYIVKWLLCLVAINHQSYRNVFNFAPCVVHHVPVTYLFYRLLSLYLLIPPHHHPFHPSPQLHYPLFLRDTS